ncbi:hypothetical protein Slin_1410 [Spirosoma linguale DSM 74]|uniref:Uncharacterized protein n=1 Tax=Spirosoma linguale (strain ATCC 33905 / DSM 74 / LMG 10896 / Claus 1) TaxID=504472 RepID=D2QMX6_SPILD|nr:hypothetical protein Slin_1410 [Spirosoma linguale DSM 74]
MIKHRGTEYTEIEYVNGQHINSVSSASLCFIFIKNEYDEPDKQ